MITERSKSIILITGYLPGSDRKLKPLSTIEWNKLASWLHQRKLMPEDLTGINKEKILSEWNDYKIPQERISKLLDRGATLAISLDKWQRAGVWVINRSDKEYPSIFKKALFQKSPPLFYGVGNKKLLSTESVGVVGSRNVSETELLYAHELGRKISNEGYSVVSGGAKGIDQNSMIGALENDGTCIGILADRLLQRSTSKIYRRHIMASNLVLLCPYHPEAKFNVGNAMSRNKFIYLKSKATFVVHSGLKGGTWTGAIENLNNKWVPIFVKQNKDSNSGNLLLLKKGAQELPASVDEISFKFNNETHNLLTPQVNLFNSIENDYVTLENGELKNPLQINESQTKLENPILSRLLELLRIDFKHGFTKKELTKKYDVLPSQIKKWLKTLEEKKYIILDSDEKYIVIEQEGQHLTIDKK